MGRLRVFSGREICKLLSNHGFAFVRQKGSPIVMQKTADSAGTITAIVPDHDEVRIGTLQCIIRQSQLPRELFEA